MSKPCSAIQSPQPKNGFRKFVGVAIGKGGWKHTPLFELIGGSVWIRCDRRFHPKLSREPKLLPQAKAESLAWTSWPAG